MPAFDFSASLVDSKLFIGASLNIMITAGPTREPLDPVRYITNHSSGKMGFAIAAAAAIAKPILPELWLVTGPYTHLTVPTNREVES